MAGSTVKLPVADPFELTNPNPPDRSPAQPPELEDALMSALEAMGAPGRHAAAPVRMAPAEATWQHAVAPPMVPPEVRPAAAPVAAPVPAVAASEPVALHPRTAETERPPEKQRLDPLDPELVARRLAQLRRPMPRPEGVVRGPRLAEPPRDGARSAGPAMPAARWEPPKVAEPPPPPPPAPVSAEPAMPAAPTRPAASLGRGRAPLRRIAPMGAPHAAAAPPAPVAPPVETDQARINDAAERALRGWSIGDGLAPATARPPKQSPRLGAFAIGALLLVGAGAGTMIVQWLAPRESAVAATPLVPGATITVAALPNKGTVAVVPTPPAAKPAETAALPAPATAATPPAVPAAPTVAAAPVVAQRPVIEATAKPVLAAPKPVVAEPAHPSWYLEDDPTTFEVAGVGTAVSVGKRMLVTADVDVRTGPDANSASMGILKAGAVVAVGDCNRWCAVTIDHRTGWVFSAFLAENGAIAVR